MVCCYAAPLSCDVRGSQIKQLSTNIIQQYCICCQYKPTIFNILFFPFIQDYNSYIMGVRKIPIGTKVPTAYFYSFINGCQIECESPLEADFCLTLEFETNIKSYESQPVKVPVDGRPRPTYPDILVYFTEDSGKRPLLVEVKHTKDLNNPKKSEDIRIKASACERYAAERGWDFKLVTDLEIRNVRLENYKFLYRFTSPPAHLDAYFTSVQTFFKTSGASSVSAVLDSLAKDKLERARILPCIWHMLRSRTLKTDLDLPLTNSSILEADDV